MTITTEKAAWGVNYDVGFNAFIVRRKDFIALGIDWFSRWDAMPRTPCPSHAFIITGQDGTVEAFADGVHQGSLSSYLHDQDACVLVRKPFGWTSDLGARIAAEASAYIGDGYNYALIGALALNNSLFGHGLDWMTRGKFGRWVDNLAESHRALICSELVAKADGAQVELLGRGILSRDPCQIKPVDLFVSDDIYAPGAIELTL